MKFLILFAWKNLFRYKKRTLITAMSLAFGIGLYILTDSLLMGISQESERNLIWYETGSARLMAEGYWTEKENLPLKYTIDDPYGIITILNKRGIKAVPRIVFGGEAIIYKDPYPEDGSVFVRIFAVDPDRDSDVFKFRKIVNRGRYLKPGEDGVLMGSWLAEDIGADIGYPLTISTRTKEGYMQAIDAVVVGIVDCPNPYINRTSLFMPMDSADLYLGMNGGATEIDLKIPDYKKADYAKVSVKDDLKGISQKIEIKTWREMGADYLALAQMKSKSSGIILLLIFVIAVAGISNTMLMAVFERERELGMIRALGMDDIKAEFAFLLEAAGIGAIGSIAGIILGIIFDFIIIHWGIDYTSILRKMDAGYRVSGILYGTWNFATMIKAFFIGIFLAAASAWYPVKRGLKLEITEALRND